ncbi:hypothetical protein [Serratia rubidaea]|uniref:hypothetical protein n=1 Tax=Serratia rubidaea TaxID=61652 RepID=UPI000AA54906|nr:hypothetical protein [Serratia rubidaea]MBS0973815.1 hypothetical protein [Serratia rubidaea]
MRQLTIATTGQAAAAACDHILIFERGKYFCTPLPGAIFTVGLPGFTGIKPRFGEQRLNLTKRQRTAVCGGKVLPWLDLAGAIGKNPRP